MLGDLHTAQELLARTRYRASPDGKGIRPARNRYVEGAKLLFHRHLFCAPWANRLRGGPTLPPLLWGKRTRKSKSPYPSSPAPCATRICKCPRRLHRAVLQSHDVDYTNHGAPPTSRDTKTLHEVTPDRPSPTAQWRPFERTQARGRSPARPRCEAKPGDHTACPRNASIQDTKTSRAAPDPSGQQEPPDALVVLAVGDVILRLTRYIIDNFAFYFSVA